jgi:hypothetical protein
LPVTAPADADESRGHMTGISLTISLIECGSPPRRVPAMPSAVAREKDASDIQIGFRC